MNARAEPQMAFALADELATRKLARTSDPATSQIAAARTVAFRADHASRILTALRDRGPMTVDQIAKVTNLTAWQVNKRLPELQRANVATPTGLTRPSASGRPERVWRSL